MAMTKSLAKKIRRWILVKGLIITIDFFLALSLNFILIISAFHKIARSRRVALLTEGGFGHTVTAPDIARRVFTDQKTLVIILSSKGRHNWCMAKIWTDVDVIYLWKYLYFFSKFQSVYMTEILLCLLRFVLGKMVYNVVADPDLKDRPRFLAWTEPLSLYQAFVQQQINIYGAISQPKTTNNEFLLYWVRSVFLNPLTQPTLPSLLDKKFMQKMDEIQPDRRGVIAVYMRRKGEDGDGLVRCGGDYQDYRPIFEAARRQGLLILVLGDRPLDECPPDIRGYLRDFRNFNLDKSWYNIAAVVKSDYFVGDPGGGSLLPCLMPMPKVMVNAFPYSQAWPGFLLLFKRLVDSKGVPVSLSRCFNKYPWTYDFGENYLLMNNVHSELSGAIDEMFKVPYDCWLSYIAESNFHLIGSYVRQGARLCEVQYLNN